MARRKAMKFRKRNTSRPLDQSCLQSSLGDRLEPEDQSSVQLSANSSFASTVCSFLSADTAFTDNTNITKPIEDGAVIEPIQINQSARDKETPVQLEVELSDEAGGAACQTRVVPADQVARARRIIAGAERAKEAEQNRAIEEAIQLLYPYPPREGQRDALRQLIYKRKDLILIAKTSFGKSMILQAVSVLTRKSTTVVVLPLDQIGQEQAVVGFGVGLRCARRLDADAKFRDFGDSILPMEANLAFVGKSSDICMVEQVRSSDYRFTS